MNKFLYSERTLIIFLTIIISSLSAFAQDNNDGFSSEANINEDLKLNVCKNEDRLEAVKKLFKKMGATDEEIEIKKIKNVENLIVIKKGKTAETVIVGAHYDKVSDGCGAIDNWTGITIIANLYRTFKQLSSEKTYVFVAFGKEESGLIGSEAMAHSIPKEERVNYCAMVNLDSFGFTYPQVMSNTTDNKLADLAEVVSKDLKIPIAEASINGASADSLSFKNEKIPAITFHGLNGKWQQYLHTSKDKLENVNVSSVFIGYRYVLAYLAKIESNNCNAFRK